MVVDPFHDLIQGVLQGHALAQQLRNESQQQEMYQRSLARSQEDDQLRDMEVRQHLSGIGRPVVGNMVSGTMPVPDPETPGGLKTVNFTRPVDRSRLLKYKDMQVEQYTPAEQALQAAISGAQGQRFAAFSGDQTAEALRQLHLQQRGVAVPDLLVQAGMAQRGEKMLQSDIDAKLPIAQKFLSPDYKDIPKDASLLQIAKPGIGVPSPSAPAAPTPPPTGPPTPFGSGAPLVNAPAGGSAAATATPTGAPTAFSSGGPLVNAPAPIPTPFAGIQDRWNTNRQNFKDMANAAGAPPAALVGAPPPAAATPPPAPDGTAPALPPGVRLIASNRADPQTEAEMAAASVDPKRTPEERQRFGDALKRLDQSKRESRPITNVNMGIPGISAQSGNTNLHGEEYLATLPPALAARVRNIATGGEVLTRGTAGGQQAMQQLQNAVYQYDSNYTPLLGQKRKDVLHQFTDSHVGSAGGQSLALNTMIHHADLYLETAKALHNGTFKLGNAVYNAVADAFGQAPPTNAALVAQFLAGETAKVATGGVPGEGEVKQVLAKLGTDAGPDQIAGAGQSLLRIAGGRAQPLIAKAKDAQLDKLGLVHVLDPDTQAILRSRGFDPETMKPVAVGAVTVTDPRGTVHSFRTQADADTFKKAAGIP